MIAADVNAWAGAYLGAAAVLAHRKLLWLRVRDAVAAKKLPATGDFAKPVFHLRDDETAQLYFSEGLRAEDGDRDEVLPGGA